jgi:hypothetical protein
MNPGSEWPSPTAFRPTATAARNTSSAAILAADDQKERDLALRPLRIGLHGGEVTVAGTGNSGRQVDQTVAEPFDALILRPSPDEPDPGPHLAPIRRRVTSLVWTLKGRLRRKRQNARPSRPQSPHDNQARRRRRERLAQPTPAATLA